MERTGVNWDGCGPLEGMALQVKGLVRARVYVDRGSRNAMLSLTRERGSHHGSHFRAARLLPHISLSNPRGKDQGNLPRLLRPLATEIAKLGDDTMILVTVIRDEVDDRGS